MNITFIVTLVVFAVTAIMSVFFVRQDGYREIALFFAAATGFLLHPILWMLSQDDEEDGEGEDKPQG